MVDPSPHSDRKFCSQNRKTKGFSWDSCSKHYCCGEQPGTISQIQTLRKQTVPLSREVHRLLVTYAPHQPRNLWHSRLHSFFADDCPQHPSQDYTVWLLLWQQTAAEQTSPRNLGLSWNSTERVTWLIDAPNWIFYQQYFWYSNISFKAMYQNLTFIHSNFSDVVNSYQKLNLWFFILTLYSWLNGVSN